MRNTHRRNDDLFPHEIHLKNEIRLVRADGGRENIFLSPIRIKGMEGGISG